MSQIEQIKNFVSHLPLCEKLGIRVISEPTLLFVLPYSSQIIGDKSTGVIHGGAISTLLDTACGSVCFTHPENSAPTATIDLRIDYMRPAKAGHDIKASAEVYQTTRHVAFVRGVAWDESPDHPVAVAMGTFVFGRKDYT